MNECLIVAEIGMLRGDPIDTDAVLKRKCWLLLCRRMKVCGLSLVEAWRCCHEWLSLGRSWIVDWCRPN